MDSRQIYLRFLNLTQAISGQWSDLSHDSTAQRLLESLAIAHAQGKPLTVTEAMDFAHVASPATLHRKLSQLIEAGFIESAFEGKNRRTKFLILTNKSVKYFEQMGKAMIKAITA